MSWKIKTAIISLALIIAVQSFFIYHTYPKKIGDAEWQKYGARDLVKSCYNLHKGSPKSEYCRGYLSASLDYRAAFIYAPHLLLDHEPCIPREKGARQISLELLKYMLQNPDKHHLTQFEIVNLALSETHPCPKKDK